MLRPFNDIKNFALAARDGEIGKVKELYFDDQIWIVRYVVVDTGGWLTGRKVLLAPVSVGMIDEPTKLIVVHLTKEQIENSPPIEADQPVSRQFEEAWYGYYGYPGYWLAMEPTVLGTAPAFVPPPAPVVTKEKCEQHGDPHLRSTSEATGYSIHASDGELGHIDDFLVDESVWAIRYVVISRSWWAGKKVIISPEWIERVSWEERKVFVSLTRETIKDAPDWDDAQPISRAFEQRLHDYYGCHGYWPLKV